MVNNISEEVQLELEALKSIYDKDFIDRDPVWDCPSFAIKIYPNYLRSNEKYSSVTVKFTLTSMYPNTIPKIDIEEYDGLNESNIRELNKIIAKESNQNLGQVMCHEIITSVQNFLEGHIEKPKTFYEVMRDREEKEHKIIDNLVNDIKYQKIDNESSDSYQGISKVAHNAHESLINSQKIINQQKIRFKQLQKGDVQVTKLNSAFDGTESGPKDANFWVKKSIEDNNSLDESLASDQESDTNVNEKSRYRQEFYEIGLIGSGGSGEVWKSKHKLDGRVYAVKKINLNLKENSADLKIRREVTTISRLLHKNIVRYYAAWIEEHDLKANNLSDHSGEDESYNSYNLMNNNFSSISQNKLLLDDHSYFSRSSIKYGMYDFNDPDNLVVFEDDNNNKVQEFPTNDSKADSYFNKMEHIYFSSSDSEESDDNEYDQDDNIENDADYLEESSLFSSINSEQKAISNSSRWMFIQMEYCLTNLRHYIDRGNIWERPLEILKLLRQITEALVYIHSKGVIHRDLKPANIFIDSDGNIKLGDFGLATIDTKAHNELDSATFENTVSDSISNKRLQSSPIPGEYSETNTGAVGTALYIAPELDSKFQVKSDEKTNYKKSRSKVDMFSLGVILFEMCHMPFTTGSERYHVLTKLREKKEFPPGFLNDDTFNFRKLIEWLLEDTEKRPTSNELLSSHLLPSRVESDNNYLKDIQEAISKPNSLASSKIINLLFENSLLNLKNSLQNKNKMDSETLVTDQDSSIHFSDDKLLYEMNYFHKVLNLIMPRYLQEKSNSVWNEISANNQNEFVKAKIKNGINSITNNYKFENSLKKILSDVFESHGALNFNTTSIQLKNSFFENCLSQYYSPDNINDSFPQFVELLDQKGEVIVLQPDLISPFAKVASFLNLQSFQRYLFDMIYIPRKKTIQEYAEHPILSHEAVYDLILPNNDRNTKIFGESDILTACLEILEKIESFLPEIVIRFCSGKIFDMIIKVCALDFENPSLFEENMKFNRSKLLKLFSYAVDSGEINQIENKLDELKCTAQFKKRIIPFLKVLNSQSPYENNNVIDTLNNLEKEFNKTEVVSQFKKEKVDSELDQNYRSGKKTPKKSIISEHEQQKLSSKSSENISLNKPNFDPIELKGIGIKKKKSKKPMVEIMTETHSGTKMPSKSDIVQADPNILRENEYSNFHSSNTEFEVSSLLNSFLEEMSYYRGLFQRLNNYQRAKISVQNDSQSTSKNYFLLDFGILLRQFGTKEPFSPFNFDDFIFVVEAFSLPPVQKVRTAYSEYLKLKGKNKKKYEKDDWDLISNWYKVFHEKYKSNHGVLAEGGHFDHLLDSYKSFYLQNLYRNVTACGVKFNLDKIVTLISQFELRIQKIPNYQTIRSIWKSKDLGFSYSNLYQSMNTLKYLVSKSCPIEVMVVVATDSPITSSYSNVEDKMTSLDSILVSMKPISKQFETETKLNIESEVILDIVSQLRAMGIKSSCFIHQLLGIKPESTFSLCNYIGISFLIVLDPNYGNCLIQVTNQNIVEYFGKEVEIRQSNIPFVVKMLCEFFQVSRSNYLGPNIELKREESTGKDPGLLNKKFRHKIEPQSNYKGSKVDNNQIMRAELSQNTLFQSQTSPHVVIFQLLILDIEPSKDRRVTKKKEFEAIGSKVTNALNNLLSGLFPVEIAVSLKPLQQMNRFVLAVEVPMAILRSFITTNFYLSNPAKVSNSTNDMVEQFNNEISKSYKKVLKVLYNQIEELKEKSSSIQGGKPKSLIQNLTIFIYSITDSNVDQITFEI